MTLGLMFWIIMLIWFLFGIGSTWYTGPYTHVIGVNWVVFILFLILGWHAFGSPISGGGR